MKKINIILMFLFLTIIVSGKAGITQSQVKEIKTGTIDVELFPFPGNYYIGEIVISKIKAIKNKDREKDDTVNYNSGFDVDAVITVADSKNDNLYINYPVQKNNTIEISLRKNDQRFIFISRNAPQYFFVVSDYENKYIVPLKVAIKNKTNISLQKRYYTGLLREIRNSGYRPFEDDELLYRFKVLENRAGISEKIGLDTSWRRSIGGGLLEMIELTSGAQAMEGSLQFSVMRDVSGKDMEQKSINISTLAQPDLKPHDFKKMLGGEKIKTAEIDRYAPFDSIYCRFSKIKYLFKCMDIAKLIQDEIPVFTKFIDWKDDNQSKLMTKLGLKINPDLKKFYGIAIEEIGIVMADPYLIEGSDMAVIFHLNNKSLFSHQIKKYRETFLKEISGSKEEKLLYNNTEITSLTSTDGRLSSYGFIDGDYAVIATSEWMAKKCVDAKNGKAKNAADNLDFQYLMKQHDGPGDAFVYIGDDFVSRIVSAQFKIGELRRVNCEANMKILKYASRLYSLENGREPNMKDLIDEGYISNIPVCPSDGSYVIAINNPHCSKHGVLGHLHNLSSNTVTLATPDEAKKYKTFVDNYHDYWRKYVDPIGIRLDFGDTISMRTIILPLIEHPDYNAIQDVFGGAPISLESLTIGNSTVIFHAAVKLKAFDNYKSDLSHLSDQRLKGFVYGAREEFSSKNPDFKGDPLAWIGNEADFFVIDEASMLNNMTERRKSFDEMAVINLIALRIKVRDLELAKRTFPAVMKVLNMKLLMPEKKYGGELWKMHANRITINILLREDGLWITPFENNLARLTQSSSFFSNISRSESDKVTSLRDVTGIKENNANFEIGIHPQNIKQLKKAVNLMTHAIYRDYCGGNIRCLNLLVDLHEPFVRISKPSEKDLIMGYKTGYSVRCPASGTYARNNEYYKCTFHDDPEDHGSASASLEKYMNAETNLSSVLHKLKSIVIDLGFTKEGLETQIYIGDPLK